MSESEVWINEGEPGEHCFAVEFSVDSDEDWSGRTIPEISVISCKENGVEIADKLWKEVEKEVYDELYRQVDGWGKD